MSTTITKSNIQDFVVTGEFDIPCSFSEDLDAKKAGDSKSVTLRFKLTNTPVSDIIASSLKDKRINVQSTIRKHPELYKDGQVLSFDYKGGQRTVVDPEVAMKARLAAMTPEARAAKVKELLAGLGA